MKKTEREIDALATSFAVKCDPLNITPEKRHDILIGYKEGYTACQDEDRWVPVRERLPKSEGLYIVMRAHSEYSELGEYTTLGFTNYHGYAVTHWQPIPIPNPPKK